MQASPSTARRRTNVERRTSMRARLMEATVECLHELGFAATTTTEVANRAGVSRGAQLHHFPTKQALVTAAIEHVLELRIAEFRRAFVQKSPKGEDRAETAVKLMWKVTQGPTFYAWLELVVAARTDPKLRQAMQLIAARFEGSVRAAFLEAFPEHEDHPAAHVAPWFTLATLQGFALDRILDPDEPRLPL
ncbi:MAG: TetR family transcriptional regulator, partial [Myxococcaceae bacterium]|nr:TetR family transcriptional regulator [Myxococcaceae bacterium]